ncbi:hypothetical protein ACG7TL_008331 [Trametes sanguinea]
MSSDAALNMLGGSESETGSLPVGATQTKINRHPHGRPLYGLPPPREDEQGRLSLIDPSEPDSQLATADLILAGCRALSNARQQVNNLPVETLTDILFYLGVPLEDWEYSFRGHNGAEWFKLRLVCRHWWAVVNTNPRFWRNISVAQNSQWWDLAVTRSGNTGLNLHFNYGLSLPTSMTTKLLPHSGRIERLKASCHQASQAVGLLPLLDSTLPSLTSLDLSLHNGGLTRSTPYEFHPANYPRLTRLSLAHIHFPWIPSAVAHLRSLELLDCTIQPSVIPFETFIDVLRCAQQLEVLILSDTISQSCDYPIAGPSDPTASIHLPKLRDLYVSEKSSWLTCFLSYLALPSDRPLSLHFSIELQMVEDDLGRLQYSSPWPIAHGPRLAIFEEATSVRLHVVQLAWALWVITCEAPGQQSLTLAFKCQTDHTRRDPRDVEYQALSYLVHLFRSAPVTKLDLALRPSGIESAAYEALISAFPGIRTLEMGFGKKDPEFDFPFALFNVLAARTDGPDANGDIARWPNLTTVVIKGIQWRVGNFLPVLLRCLSQRAEYGAPKLDSLTLTIFRSVDPEIAKDWDFVDHLFQGAFGAFADTCTYIVRPQLLYAHRHGGIPLEQSVIETSD